MRRTNARGTAASAFADDSNHRKTKSWAKRTESSHFDRLSDTASRKNLRVSNDMGVLDENATNLGPDTSVLRTVDIEMGRGPQEGMHGAEDW